MWMHLLKYEFKKSLADGFLWIQTIMIIGFTVTAINIGYNWFRFNKETINKIQQTEQEQWAVFKKDAKSYNNNFDTIKVASPNHPVTVYYAKRGYTFKIPDPISIFNIGQGDIYAHYNSFTGVEPQKLLTEGELLNPLNQLIGRIDLSFFVIYILPLLIIAWAFDLFSNEKELGTLRLLYMQQVCVEKVVVGKLIFRIIYFTVLLAIIIFSAYFFIDEFDYHHLKGVFLYFVMVIFYITFWFSLAFLVNSLGKSSAFNGMTLIGFWVILLFLVPSLLNVCVNNIYPVPDRKQHIVEERLFKKNPSKKMALSAFFRAYPQYQIGLSPSLQDKYVVPVNWYPEYLASQWTLNCLKSKQDKAIFQCLNQQHKLIGNLLFLSPALVCQTTMNQLSKTNFDGFYDFFEAAKLYRTNWQIVIYDKLFAWNYFTEQDFASFNNFHHLPKPIHLNFSWRFSILFCLVLVLFTAGFMNFRKFTFQWI